MNVKINFSVSNSAAEKLSEIVDKNSFIRIDAKSSGCSGSSYSLAVEEKINDLDLVEEIEGLKFIVSKQSAMLLDEVVLDWYESEDKEGFRFVNNFKQSKCCKSGSCS